MELYAYEERMLFLREFHNLYQARVRISSAEQAFIENARHYRVDQAEQIGNHRRQRHHSGSA